MVSASGTENEKASKARFSFLVCRIIYLAIIIIMGQVNASKHINSFEKGMRITVNI